MYHHLLTNLQTLPLKLILSNTVKNYLKQGDFGKSRYLFSTLNCLNNGKFQAKINKQIVKKISSEYSAVCALIKRSNRQSIYNLASLNSIRQFHSSVVNRQTPSSDPSKKNNKKPKKDDENDDNKLSSLFAKGFLWMLTAYMVIAVISLLFPNSNQPEVIRYVSWNEFVHHMLAKGEVQEIIVRPDVEIVTIILHEGAVIKGKRMEHRTFHMNVADIHRFEEKLREAERRLGVKEGVPINYERGGDTAGKLLLSLVIVALLMSLLSRTRSLGGSLRMDTFTQLGRAKFTLVDPLTGPGKGVHFNDVAGLRQAKLEVMEFVDYLKRPEHYRNLGAKVPKGALLLGPPGCGKTMLAKAVATESNVPFLSMNGSEFIEMIGGLGAARVRDLFKEAKKRSPCIIYIDEIDAVGRKRSQISSAGSGGMSGESEQTLNQLLVEMDGMASKEGIIMLASTNRADILDKALLRPGRFDRHILIDLPDLEEREQIFAQHLKGISLELSPEYYSKRLAYLTPGFSGADIANVCNEAALHAARCKQLMVTGNNLEYAVERLVGGTEKRNHAMSPQEKKIVAYHESGHALVGWMLKHTDALLKVTIVPRTNLALGFAQYVPTDQKIYSQEQLFERMCMILGGRVAESLTFNRITTGAQNDLEKATKMAYAQIREYGMNKHVGLICFTEQEIKDLGRRPFSKRLATTMDEEAKKLIFRAYKKTEGVLIEHKIKLQTLAEELIKRETLNYNDVEIILGPPPFGKKRLIEPADFEASLKKEVSKKDDSATNDVDIPSSNDTATKS